MVCLFFFSFFLQVVCVVEGVEGEGGAQSDSSAGSQRREGRGGGVGELQVH